MACTSHGPCSEVHDRLADGRMGLVYGVLTLGNGIRVAGPCPFCRTAAVGALVRSWDQDGLAAEHAEHLERQRAAELVAPAEAA